MDTLKSKYKFTVKVCLLYFVECFRIFSCKLKEFLKIEIATICWFTLAGTKRVFINVNLLYNSSLKIIYIDETLVGVVFHMLSPLELELGVRSIS